MRELFGRLLGGWKDMTGNGKFMVLLLGSLLYLWGIRGRGTGLSVRQPGERRALPGDLLLQYTTLFLALILFPPAAILLDWYQTRFYDFGWMIALLPMTLTIAYGATRAVTDCYEKYCQESVWKTAGLAAMALAVLLLCGNLDTERQWLDNGSFSESFSGSGQVMTEEEKQIEALAVLEYLEENGAAEDVCLWAPALVLDYIRRTDGSVRLLYGRNMWDEALNAYSYDSYPQKLREAYAWMEESASYLQNQGGSAEIGTALEESVHAALDGGVNVIVLPWERGEDDGGIPDALTAAVRRLGYEVTVGKDWGYYFFRIGS